MNHCSEPSTAQGEKRKGFLVELLTGLEGASPAHAAHKKPLSLRNKQVRLLFTRRGLILWYAPAMYSA